MQKILLDTNFLLLPSQFKVDIFSEIERIFAKEHAQYVNRLLLGSNYPDSLEALSSQDPKKYAYALAYEESIGIAVMSRVAKERGHTDEHQFKYEIEKNRLIKDFASSISGGNPNEFPFELFAVVLAYHLAEPSKSLNEKKFREWLRINPVMVSPQEVDHTHRSFYESLQQHF